MEIKWHDIDPETGQRRYLCAERFAGKWSFRWKLQRRGDWTPGLEPTARCGSTFSTQWNAAIGGAKASRRPTSSKSRSCWRKRFGRMRLNPNRLEFCINLRFNQAWMQLKWSL